LLSRSVGACGRRAYSARPRLRWTALLGLAIVIGGVAQAPSVSAQPTTGQQREAPDKRTPVRFSADEVTYDKQLGIITLRGKVQLFQGERILTADTVTYNQTNDLATANGNVVLMEPTGEVVFSTHMELTKDLKEGMLNDIRMLLADNSRFAANGGSLRGTRTYLNQAVFSPCELCAKDPSRPPLWQIKAAKVMHDSQTKDIYFRDMTLELWGIPVFYTPYFSAPDPTVKRRTGVLPPEFALSSHFGASITLPYYWAISDSEDFTIAPRITTKGGQGLDLEYRRRFDSGSIDLLGSGIYDPNNNVAGDFRGHIDGKGRFEINDSWRAGFDAERTTDKTYLREYGFKQPPAYLQSDVFVEGFSARSYASANAYLFQQLRNDLHDRQTPVVAPLFQGQLVGDPDRWGGHYTLDARMANIMREEGTDSTKLSVRAAWTLPYIGGWGDVWKFTTSLQGDIYDVHNGIDPNDPTRKFTGVTGRILPQASLEWRWPLVSRSADNSYKLIEPIVVASVAPSLGRQWRIPNEESADIVFDETNLLNPNRFVGTDRLEGGQRITYGARFGLFSANGDATTLFLGQSFRFNDKQVFPDSLHTDSHISDVIAALQINPGSWWDGFARLRMDSQSLRVRQADLLTTLGPQQFRVSLNYTYISDALSTLESFGARQEINVGITSRIDEHWTLGAIYSADIEAGKTRLYGGSVRYEDECFVFGLQAQRRLYHDNFLSPDTRVLFQIVFKQLTSVQSRVY
jgi:LPS-assembly protein